MDKKKSPSKKEARHLIEKKIETSLADLKTVLGDKEFESRVKKVAKIFAKGFKGEAVPKEKPAAPKEKMDAPVTKQVVPAPKAAAKKVVKKAAKKK